MKCEHEGCEKNSVITIRTRWRLKGQTRETEACAEHAGPHLRELADEVEGVQECPECDGNGMHESEQSDNMFWRCDTCHGTGRVPRWTGRS